MAITLDGLNINDGSKYFVLAKGVNLGQPQTTWDEVPSYAGDHNAQANVHVKQGLIPVTIPMMVKGTSVANLLDPCLKDLWTKVDSCTYAAPKTLVWDSESFSIVYSSRPETIERDEFFQLSFTASFTLTLMRLP